MITDTDGSRYRRYLLPSVPVNTTTPAPSGAPSDGRSTRWAGHRAQRRRELVEATLRAIRQYGAGVGLDDIAAVAGTSKTVFYRHFTDRSGLYAAVSESVDARILRDLTAAMGSSDGDLATVDTRPRELVSGAIDAYLQLVERDPEVYRFVVSAPLLDRRPDGDPASPVTGHIAEQMSVLLAAGLASAGRDTAAAHVWAAGLVGLVRAGADQWLAHPASMSRADLAQHLTDLAWGGLSAAWPGHLTQEDR